jgi:toxin ParE1/3/4
VSLPVVLRDEAYAEFDEAFDFYEGRRKGLGVDFVARVQQVFDRIAANPRIHAVVVANIRKAVVTRFPYCVLPGRGSSGRSHRRLPSRRDPSIWQGRA